MPQDNEPTLGQYLRRDRLARGLTLRALAERVGANHSYLARIERGLVLPSAELVFELSKALDWDQDLTDRLTLECGHVPAYVHKVLLEHPALMDDIRAAAAFQGLL